MMVWAHTLSGRPARSVEIQTADRHGTANDHVGNLFGRELRDPVQNATEDLCGPINGMGASQSAFLGPAYGGTAVCGNHCLCGHTIPP